MTNLANFPLISQQTQVSGDGSSPNATQDCVPTSLMAGIMFLNGVAALDAHYNPDTLLDTAYPEGYKGGTAAENYIPGCAKYGVHLFSITGNPTQLVQAIHEQLAQLHPVAFTIPDPYVPASYGWTHVLCAYADSAGTITSLDPWPGKPTTKTDAEWEGLLQFNQIWVMEKIGGVSMGGIPGGWTDNGTVLHSPNNVQGQPEMAITGPFRDYILANPWPNGNVALEEGHHLDVMEQSNPHLGGGFVQTFRYSRLEMPDSTGKVIFAWFGIELLYTQAQLHQAQFDLATQKHEVATLTTQLQQANAQVATEQEQVKTLQTELASHPDVNSFSNRLSAIGMSVKQAQDFLTEVQGLVVQPL